MFFECTEFYLKGDSKGYIHQPTEIFSQSQEIPSFCSNLDPPPLFLIDLRKYLQSPWKMFKGQDIIQLELNFKNLLSFIESMVSNIKTLKTNKMDFAGILSESLDILFLFLNKLAFYDFKLKTPLDSGLFKDEDFLNFLMFSDDWTLNLKYIAVFYKLMNYNAWKLDIFDLYKQKKMFMFAYSFLSSKYASREALFSLLEPKNKGNLMENKGNLMEKEGNLMGNKGNLMKDKENLIEKEEKLRNNDYIVKFHLEIDKKDVTLNLDEILKDNSNENSYEIVVKIAKKLEFKENSLEFLELLLETKLRRDFTYENRFIFIFIAVFFENIIYDNDYKQFFSLFNLKNPDDFTIMKETDKIQILLYLLSLSQKDQKLFETSLILLIEMKKPEYHQENEGFSLEKRIIEEFQSKCDFSLDNFVLMKLLIKIGLNLRNYLKAKRLKILKFELLKEMAGLMESLDLYMAKLLRRYFPDEDNFAIHEKNSLLEDFSQYFLNIQNEKPSISLEINRFPDVSELKSLDYFSFLMVQSIFFVIKHLKFLMESLETPKETQYPLLDYLILSPIRYFGQKRRVFLLKLFINEGIFTDLLLCYEKKSGQMPFYVKSYIHTLINNILYFSLSQDPDLKDFIFENRLETLSILQWFRLFCEEKFVVFLCNFNLMKPFIEDLAKKHEKNLENINKNPQDLQFCNIYVEIVLKDLLLWGSSGLKLLDDIALVRFLKPLFIRKFEELLNEIRLMVDGDLSQIEGFFKYREENKNICENLTTFFQYLGYKYQKILININFILNTLFSDTYFGVKIHLGLYQSYMQVFFKLALPFLGGIPKEALNVIEHHIIEETGKSPILLIINNLKLDLLKSKGFLKKFKEIFNNSNIPIFYNLYSISGEKLFQSIVQGKLIMNFEGFSLLIRINVIEANLGLLKWMLQKYNKSEYYKEDHEQILEDLKLIYEEILDWYINFLDLIVEEYNMRLQGSWKEFKGLLEKDEDNQIYERNRLFKFLKNHVVNLSSITKVLSEKNRLFRYMTNISKRILKFSQIIKDLNKKATEFSLNILKMKLFALKRKFIEENLDLNNVETNFPQILKNLFWLDEINRVIKHSLSFHKSELPWLIFDDEFIEKLRIFVNSVVIKYLISHQQINMECFELSENRDNPKLLETQCEFKFILSFFKEICCKILIYRPYEELFHTLNRENCQNEDFFIEKLKKIVDLNRSLMGFWKYLNRWNEDIPDAMTNIYESLYRVLEKDLKSLSFFKMMFQKVGFAILELFLFSAYDNQIRIRSCYSFAIIHHIIINKSLEDPELHLIEKKKFATYFIEILTDHFKTIWEGWSLESSQILYKIASTSEKIIEIKYSAKANKLDYMTNCCTHAMILNLVSRLIQETIAHDPKIEDGVIMMFNDWRSIYEYNRYVAEIFVKMKARKLIDDEIKTLDNDTIENGIILLKKALGNINIMKVDFWQLKEVSLLLLENYLDQHETQMKFDNKKRYAKYDKIKSFLELYLAGLNSIINKNNRDSLFQEFKEKVLNKLKNTRYSTNHEKNKFLHNSHVLLTRICDIFMFFDQIDFLSANLRVKFQGKFLDSQAKTLKEQIAMEIFAKDEEINALFGAHNKVFLEVFLNNCEISQGSNQSFFIKMKHENYQGRYNPDKTQEEILVYFIERCMKSFQELIINIKDEEMRKTMEYDLIDSCYALNVLTFFAGKYPLLIPMISNYELFLNNEKIYFIDYLLEISTKYFNLGKRLFLIIVSNHYFFEKSTSSSNENLITTSGSLWLRYMKEALFKKLKVLAGDIKNFLRTDENVVKWKLTIELLRSMMHNFFIETKTNLDAFSLEINEFLWEIVKTREKTQDLYFLEQTYVFSLLAEFSEKILQRKFKLFTGFEFDKKKHKNYLKHYSNLFFNKYRQNPLDFRSFLSKKEETDIEKSPDFDFEKIKIEKLFEKSPNNNNQKYQRKTIEFSSEILKIKANSHVNPLSINKLHIFYIDYYIDLENSWQNTAFIYKFSRLFSYFEILSKESQEFLCLYPNFYKYLHICFETNPPYLKNIDDELLLDIESLNRNPSISQRNYDLYLILMDLSVELLVKDEKEEVFLNKEASDNSNNSQKQANNYNNNEENKEEKQEEIIEINKDLDILEKPANSKANPHPIDQILLDLGVPSNFMYLYKIEESNFATLSSQEKIEFVLEKQANFPLGEKPEFEAISSNNIFLFEEYNFPSNSLELYEIDMEFFNGIPLEYKLEVLEQGKREYEEKKKTLNKSLNEKKKLETEILKQAFFMKRELKLMGFLKEKQDFGLENYEENGKDIEEIAEVLIFYWEQNENKKLNKILLMLPKKLIEYLPMNLKEMALNVRPKILENGLNDKNQEEKNEILEFFNKIKQKSNHTPEYLLEFFEKEGEFDKSSGEKANSFDNLPEIPEFQRFQDQDFEFFLNLPILSGKALINLIKALNSVNVEDEDIDGKIVYKENKGIFRLMKKLIYNPINAFRILNLFFKILNMDKNNENLAIFQGDIKENVLAGLKSKILVQLDIFLNKKIVLPLILKEGNMDFEGNLIYSDLQKIAIDFKGEDIENPGILKEELLKENSYNLSMLILGLLKDNSNENGQDRIFKCLHSLIERQDEENMRIHNHKEKVIIESNKILTFRRFLKKETLDIIINYLITKKLRFNDKSDQKNEIFQTLTSFCQENNNFEIFSITFLEKLAINMNRSLEIILLDLYAYKEEIGLERIPEFDKKNEHENDFKLVNFICNEIFKKHEELYDSMYYFKKIIKDLRFLFENTCLRKTIRKLSPFPEIQDISEVFLKKKWLWDLNLEEKESQMKVFKKELNQNENLLSFSRTFFEIIYFLIDFIGTDFKEDSSGSLYDCYNFFIFGVKSLMLLQDFLTMNCEKNEELSFTPTLSRLNTKDYSLEKHGMLSRKFSKQYEKISFKTLEDGFKYLYYKMSPVVGQYMKEKPENISKIFGNYIKKSPSSIAVSSEIKFSYLKWQSINKAKKLCNSMEYEDNEITIKIKRDQIWHSTLETLLEITPCELILRPIKVNFDNEIGSDFGGLTREWLALLNKEIFNPDYGLFQLSANKTSYQPSLFSFSIPDHLTHFRMLGRLIGKTMIDNTNFEVHFVKSFLKHMLKKTLYIEDLNDIDPELEKNLQWVLKSPIDEFEFKFCYDSDWFGTIKTIDLKEKGRNELVTEFNKKEYVKLLAFAKMGLEIQQQTEAFLLGFQEIIPSDALFLLDEKDLGLKLSGMPNIDIEEMKKFTEYVGFPKDHFIMKWFWEIMEEFSEEMKANFLFFLSGSFNVPFGGFKNFSLKIEKIPHSKEALPVAHTCFNQLDLPQYESKEIMKEKILIALTEGSKGFYIG